MNAEELGREISNFVNRSSKRDLQDLAKVITTDHRTLQQKTFNLMMECVAIWAGQLDANRWDARNEWTVKASKKITEIFDIDNESVETPIFIDGKPSLPLI